MTDRWRHSTGSRRSGVLRDDPSITPPPCSSVSPVPIGVETSLDQSTMYRVTFALGSKCSTRTRTFPPGRCRLDPTTSANGSLQPLVGADGVSVGDVVSVGVGVPVGASARSGAGVGEDALAVLGRSRRGCLVCSSGHRGCHAQDEQRCHSENARSPMMVSPTLVHGSGPPVGHMTPNAWASLHRRSRACPHVATTQTRHTRYAR